jgi:hypothetical protein
VRDIFIDFAFLSILLLLPVGAFALMRWAGISVREYSLPSFFVVAYLTGSYIGVLPLYLGLDSYSASLGVRDLALIREMAGYSSAGLLGIALGFVFARHLVRLRPRPVEWGQVLRTTAKQRLMILGLLAACIFVLAAYLSNVRSIALFTAISDGPVAAALSRSEMTNGFSGKYWRYSLFFRLLLDYCVVFLFVDAMVRRSRLAWVIFGVALGAAMFSALMSIQKAPVLHLIIMIYLALTMLTDGRYWQPVAKYLTPLVLGLLVVMNLQFMGARSAGGALAAVGTRVLTGQIAPSYFYLERFPEFSGYLMGRSFPNPGGILPFEPVRLTVEISRTIFPGDYSREVVGSAPTVFWAEMYANFGPVGAVLSSVLVGVMLFGCHVLLRRRRLSAALIAATTVLTIHFKSLTQTGLSSYLIDIPLFVVVGVTVLLTLAAGSARSRMSPVQEQSADGSVRPTAQLGRARGYGCGLQ